LARQHRLLPLWKRGNKLFVAVSDPSNQQAINDVQFSTGLTTEGILVEDDKLGAALDKFFENATSSMTDLDDVDLDGLDIQSGNDDKAARDDGEAADDAPVVRFVNKMLLDAIRGGSSDLHFEPYEKAYRVRLRTDGVLHEVARPSIQLAPRISARLKVMAGLDISERRKPQDGRIKMKLSKTKAIDFRVNTLPTLWGEKIVMRILDPSSAQMGIDALGYEESQKQLYMDALKQPQGMILVTGPTGHRVMSDLHANSDAQPATRLRNMGVAAFNIATSVNLIIAQRLARKLCSSCKKEIEVPRDALLKEGFPEESIGTFKIYGPVGCENCVGGYKGRVGIYEVEKNTPALARIIMEDGNSIDISTQMRKDGFNDLRTSALIKAMQGVTSLEEVNRVTKD